MSLPPATRREARLGVEELEARRAPSADLSQAVAVPLAHVLPQAGATVTGLTPSQVRRAYGFDRITFASGTVSGDGAGQTIAIVTAYDHPSIVEDLQTFSKQFGLPDPPSFTRATPQGTPTVDPLWALETALDVQWAHAIAPRANLLLVQARSATVTDLAAAVDYARRQPGVTVVSMSWGIPEFSTLATLDATFTTPAGHPGVTFVAASGDSGASVGPLWPAVSPNVLAVGGTQLVTDLFGNYVAESGWAGSGGGTSRYVSAPSFQRPVTGGTTRSSPDVAYNAAEASGFTVYTSIPINGQSGWLRVGGTSGGAPQWAALVAVANQGRALAGKAALTNTLASLYALPASSFHDVVTGSNGLSAGPGYDLVTGRGTPYADRIVSGLAGETTPAPTPRINFGAIRSRVANFFAKTTSGSATRAAAPALRLPAGPGMALGGAADNLELAHVVLALRPRRPHDPGAPPEGPEGLHAPRNAVR